MIDYDEILLVEKWKDANAISEHGKQEHFKKPGELKTNFITDTIASAPEIKDSTTEESVWGMVKFTWFKDLLPEQLPVKQVYGIAFSDDKRVVLRIEDGKYKLTGGKPENAETFEETLKREYIEELNIELEDIYYLGYLLVEENSDKYAQVRMIAKIKDIHDSHIDPATGKIYGRELVTADRIKDYLNYLDNAGNEMIDDAVQIAMNNYF